MNTKKQLFKSLLPDHRLEIIRCLGKFRLPLELQLLQVSNYELATWDCIDSIIDSLSYYCLIDWNILDIYMYAQRRLSTPIERAWHVSFAIVFIATSLLGLACCWQIVSLFRRKSHKIYCHFSSSCFQQQVSLPRIPLRQALACHVQKSRRNQRFNIHLVTAHCRYPVP